MFKLPFSSLEAWRAAAEARSGIGGILFLSLVIALFPVTTVLFLLLVFDVAIPGRSGSTLAGLFILYAAILGVFLVLGGLRRRMLAHVGNIIQSHFMPRLDETTARMGKTSQGGGDGLQATRDLDMLQGFFRSRTATTWLDIGALPVALITMLFLHPWLALCLLLGAAALAAMLWQSAGRIEQPLRDAVGAMTRRQAITESGRSYHDVLQALGMKSHAMRAWIHVNRTLSAIRHRIDAGQIWYSTGARSLMLAVIAIILSVGAWLTITDHASAAVTIAAAVLAWLTLEPWVMAIDSLPESLAARQGWTRLDTLLFTVREDGATLSLPDPKAMLECQFASVAPPGTRSPVVHGITLELAAGDVMGVVGPAGCGKSALVRGMIGVWPLVAGKVRLDGAALDQWDSEHLARHIGYLPQDVDLIDGTVAENIARFNPDADPEQVVQAARNAHAHDLIVRLPEGYNSRVGPNGRRLSASQRQRIALARALYGEPFLVVLDEPTAHLDTVGMQAFAASVTLARDRGAIVIIAGNANNFLSLANQVLILRDGMMADFGERDAVRQRVADRRKQVEIGVVKGETAASDAPPAAPSQDSRTEEGTP